MYKNPVISIDFGTQSVRVSIINNKGEFLAFEKVTYDKPYFSIKPGYCEQDPEYYYSCMCKASQALVEKNKDLVAKCEYFSITCFRDTAAYLDENYKNSINDKIGVKEYLGHSNSILNSIAQLVQKVKSG